uniref:Delta like non-canonical Notch ligand 2 n=1 Tax=Lepisosteus oculatus TaxID=7918 RepID=W5NJ49_LEPOC
MLHRFSLHVLLLSVWLLTPRCAGQDGDCESHCNLGHGRCDGAGTCRCDPGWEGPQCEDCVKMPGCVHGSCHQPWQCTCESGWAGRFCDKDIYVCSNQLPCLNGATCIANEDAEYTCFCPEGFHGRHCQLKIGPCERTRSPCKNGGTCLDDSGHAAEFSCRCLAGFAGPRCEVDVDDCLMRPCANGATCRDGLNRFTCECPAGFEGRFCTVNIDDCAGGPCLNGGRCYDRVNTFDCLCPRGYTGKACGVQLRRPSPEARPDRTALGPRRNASPAGGWTTAGGGGGGERLLKISVKEVATRPGSGLTEVQLIVLLVFGAMTLAVVGLTAALVLRSRWQRRGDRARCAPRRCQPTLTPAEEESKVSILHAPAPKPKKKLNTEVI